MGVGRWVVGGAVLAASIGWGLKLGVLPGPARPTPSPGALPAHAPPGAPTPRPAAPAAAMPDPDPKPAKPKPKPNSKPKPKPKPAAGKAKPKPRPKPKVASDAQAPAFHRQPDFSFAVPAGWRYRKLPSTGQPPRHTRRVELWREVDNGRASIEVEADRSEPIAGRFPVREARDAAGRVARTFGFGQYAVVDLQVKAAPGFYESWVVSEVPGRAPFRVVAAHFFRGGTRYRVGAVTPLGDDVALGERGLRQVLSSWRWTPTARARRRP